MLEDMIKEQETEERKLDELDLEKILKEEETKRQMFEDDDLL